jgi:hypothetical protein
MAGISIADRHAATPDERAITLYETEDWVGVRDWLTVPSGFVMVFLALYLHFAQHPVAMPAVRWATDGQFAATVAASQPAPAMVGLPPGRAEGRAAEPGLIRDRFPKCVRGFLVAPAVFSFLLVPEVVGATRPMLSGLETSWFAMAFVCIGLETGFTDLMRLEGGRPAPAFLGAQAAAIVWAPPLASVRFSGRFVPVPAIG